MPPLRGTRRLSIRETCMHACVHTDQYQIQHRIHIFAPPTSIFFCFQLGPSGYVTITCLFLLPAWTERIQNNHSLSYIHRRGYWFLLLSLFRHKKLMSTTALHPSFQVFGCRDDCCTLIPLKIPPQTNGCELTPAQHAKTRGTGMHRMCTVQKHSPHSIP